MLYIILIGDENLNIDAIKNIEHYGASEMTDLEEDRIVVNYGEDHIFYLDEGNDTYDYEEEDLKRIPFKEPHFIVMTYRSEKRMKAVLRQDNFIKGIYVDNDYGDIIPIEEFNLREGL